MSLALYDGSQSQHLLHYGLIVHCLTAQQLSLRHLQQFHGFPQIQVQILETTCHETYHLISVYEVCHEFLIFHTPIDDDLMESLDSLSNKVDGSSLLQSEISHGEVTHLDSLVHHVHGCIETSLHIVLHITGPNLQLVHEGGELSARACCKDRRVNVVVVKRKPYV